MFVTYKYTKAPLILFLKYDKKIPSGFYSKLVAITIIANIKNRISNNIPHWTNSYIFFNTVISVYRVYFFYNLKYS